jgi:hypothetical protein
LAEGIEWSALDQGATRSAKAIGEAQRPVREDGRSDQGNGPTEGQPDKGTHRTHARTLGSSGRRPMAVMTR